MEKIKFFKGFILLLFASFIKIESWEIYIKQYDIYPFTSNMKVSEYIKITFPNSVESTNIKELKDKIKHYRGFIPDEIYIYYEDFQKYFGDKAHDIDSKFKKSNSEQLITTCEVRKLDSSDLILQDDFVISKNDDYLILYIKKEAIQIAPIIKKCPFEFTCIIQ